MPWKQHRTELENWSLVHSSCAISTMGTNLPTGLQVRKSSGDIRARKTVIWTVLRRYLYISCAPQRHCLLSQDKTLLFSSRFSKLTGISHSIIIIAFPSVFHSRCEERTRHRRHSLANERLDSPLPERYHYPFSSTISVIKGQQK